MNTSAHDKLMAGQEDQVRSFTLALGSKASALAHYMRDSIRRCSHSQRRGFSEPPFGDFYTVARRLDTYGCNWKVVNIGAMGIEVVEEALLDAARCPGGRRPGPRSAGSKLEAGFCEYRSCMIGKTWIVYLELRPRSTKTN